MRGGVGATPAKVLLAVVLAISIGGCLDDHDEPDGVDDSDDVDLDQVGDRSVSADEVSTDDLLAELLDGGFCDPADIENEGVVTAMHFVVRGELQPVCYTDAGGDDPRLLDAWDEVTSLAPRSLYDDVSLLAGFESCDGCDTLAFVTTLDVDASFFLLAVAVDDAAADPVEARFTMMHELTHVFAQDPDSQLDVTSEPDACTTWFNGNGCLRDGSYLLDWIDAFWTDDMLDRLPADGDSLDDDEAFELCEVTGDFTGAYAATSPEEDFAESFAAYVFDVDVPPELDDKLAFFDAYPEFVAARERALAVGVGGVAAASFDYCR